MARLIFLIRWDYKCQITFYYNDMDIYNQNKAIWKQDSKKNSRIIYIIDLSNAIGPHRHVMKWRSALEFIKLVSFFEFVLDIAHLILNSMTISEKKFQRSPCL